MQRISKRNAKAGRKQRGFTLVEMSVSMAAAGLLFAAVTTGQELVDQAKATKFINDVKAVEAQLQQYAQFKGRLPGDCDRDGVIDYNAGATVRKDESNDIRADKYSYSNLLPTIPGAGVVASDEANGCALVGGAQAVADVTPSTSNANVWLNDLKLAGVVSDSAPNRQLAKMVNEDFLFVGSVVDQSAGTAVDAAYNAIVIHNVPQWMARRLATAINGQDALAYRTRVRMLSATDGNDGTYVKAWEGSGAAAPRDAMVSVVYYFDRIPSVSTTPL